MKNVKTIDKATLYTTTQGQHFPLPTYKFLAMPFQETYSKHTFNKEASNSKLLYENLLISIEVHSQT